jgi:hypothetical protein
MNCPKCSTENRPEAKYCKRCNQRLVAAAQPAYRPDGAAPAAAEKRRTVVEGSAAPPNNSPAGNPAAPLGKRTVVEGTVMEPQGGHGGAAAPVPGSRPVADSRRLVGWMITYDLDDSGIDYQIREGRNFIGSDAGAVDVVIPRSKDSKVSSEHSLILYKKGTIKIADKMSTNGTWVDVDTASREKYPNLHEGESDGSVATGNFVDTTVTFVDCQDEQVRLRDNSFVLIGSTVFKVKLV